MKKSLMMHIKRGLIPTLMLNFLVACTSQESSEDEVQSKKEKATLVTVTTVQKTPIEITESSIGTLQSLIDPIVAAELPARVVMVHVNIGDKVQKGQLIATLDASDFNMQANEAQAEVSRVQGLLDNQVNIVNRNQALVQKNFISQTVIDNDTAQLNALKQQLEAAKSRLGAIQHNANKNSIFAPVSGIIQTKSVDRGDYVRIGDPIVQIVSRQKMRAHLPFPEQLGTKLKAGLPIRLTTPTSNDTINTVIHELKPMMNETSHSIDVIADIDNAPDWQPGASVTGTVILSKHKDALMVPEQSVVLRPAGEVIYIVINNQAIQRIVKTGIRQNGEIEILSGIKPDETVVVDGAGFLTDHTPIKINP